MKSKHSIFINGQEYDAITGLPAAASTGQARRIVSDIGAPRPAAKKAAPAAVLAPKKSQTLRREAVSKPAGNHQQHTVRRRPGMAKPAKSPLVSHFAAHPAALPQAQAVAATAPVVRHSVPVRAAAPATIVAAPAPAPTPSGRELKEQLISQKLAEVEHARQSTVPHKPRRSLRGFKPRVSSVVAASLGLMILGGYLTYLNMPSLSVRVAAAQAGINAQFPEYRPDGYRFDGPIAFAPGEVSIRFKANGGGDQAYTIKQSTSSWDSQAVLDNYVTKRSRSYLTYSEKGLTIYTYENKAAWVNGGILYAIDGNAPLSNEQVLRIAASL